MSKLRLWQVLTLLAGKVPLDLFLYTQRVKAVMMVTYQLINTAKYS